jgi:hypothetical protein
MRCGVEVTYTHVKVERIAAVANVPFCCIVGRK